MIGERLCISSSCESFPDESVKFRLRNTVACSAAQIKGYEFAVPYPPSDTVNVDTEPLSYLLDGKQCVIFHTHWSPLAQGALFAGVRQWLLPSAAVIILVSARKF